MIQEEESGQATGAGHPSPSTHRGSDPGDLHVVSTPRAPPMCLVLGAGEMEMNEPQRLALGLMRCVGGRGRQTEDYSIQG